MEWGGRATYFIDGSNGVDVVVGWEGRLAI